MDTGWQSVVYALAFMLEILALWAAFRLLDHEEQERKAHNRKDRSQREVWLKEDKS